MHDDKRRRFFRIVVAAAAVGIIGTVVGDVVAGRPFAQALLVGVTIGAAAGLLGSLVYAWLSRDTR